MFKETKLWHDNRCVGTVVLDKDHTATDIVVEVLNLVFTKQDNYTVSIIVNDLSVGGRIVDKLTDIDSKYRELIKKCNIKIIAPNMPLYDAQLTILVCPKTITDGIRYVLEHSRFKLVICDKLITDVNVTKDLYKICPLLNYVVKNETKSKKYSSPPVEEEVIGIDIDPSSPTGIKLDKCDRYIEESINIFGDFQIMDKARRGDVEHNISAQDVCNQIAEVNGWTQSLDMSFPYNVQIDAMYNPNNLNERANQTYDVIRTRTELLSTFPDKLEKVYELVTSNKDSNILMKIYLNNDVKFMEDFLEKFCGKKSFEEIYNNFLFRRDDEIDALLKPINKNLDKYLKKMERKNKWINLISRFKNTMLKNKAKALPVSNSKEKHKQFTDYYKQDNFHYVIEVQLWADSDYAFNIWTGNIIYDNNYRNIAR